MNTKSIWMMLVLLLCSQQASAIVISFDSATSVGLNDSVSVNVNVSGLGNYSPSTLGAFYVSVLFDPGVLSFNSAQYGPFLGNPDDPFETDIVTTAVSGRVSLDEFSFLFDYELDGLQPGNFTLATLNFTGIGEGFSKLSIGDTDISDGVGNTIISTLIDGGINVESKTSVPEPSSLSLLFVLGVGLMLLKRQGRES